MPLEWASSQLLLSHFCIVAGGEPPAQFLTIHSQTKPYELVAHQPAGGMYAQVGKSINDCPGHVALLGRHQRSPGPYDTITPLLLALYLHLAQLQAA